MTLYRIDPAGDQVQSVKKTTFQEAGMHERALQNIFRDNFHLVVPDAMVLAEEFSEWEDSRRRIDLLCLDQTAKLVVVELKRTEDGGHMELQALRYAAMVSHMTFDRAVEAHQSYLQKNGRGEENARQIILNHLAWDEPQEDVFASDVSIVLAAADFSNEIMTTVMWLGERDIDIRCIKLMPYRVQELDNDLLLNIEQIYPLPETADYLVRWREKAREERRQRRQNQKFRLTIGNEVHPNLPKRRLAFLVILAAVGRGANPLNVCPQGRWLIVPGHLTETELLEILPNKRDEDSSEAESRFFFTKDDELIHHRDKKTYALNKIWGPETLDVVNRIIDDFGLDDITYEPMN